MAVPSSVPLGSRPSVSTVKESATGIPAARAARATPIASSTYVMVIAVTISAVVDAKVRIWGAWYTSASSVDMVSPTA